MVTELQQPMTFEREFVRVWSSPPFMAVFNVYRRRNIDIGQFVHQLGNMIDDIVIGRGDLLMLCGYFNCGTLDGELDPRLLQSSFRRIITSIYRV